MWAFLRDRLTSIIPWYARILMLVAFAAALVGWGYLHGFLREEHKFDAYQAQVDAIGKAAIERNVRIRADQAKSTKEVKDGYEKTIADIRAAGPRILYKYARCSPVPLAASGSKVPDGPASESGTAGPAADQDSDGITVGQEFIMACAMDAARVNWYRAFVIKNHLPVE